MNLRIYREKTLICRKKQATCTTTKGCALPRLAVLERAALCRLFQSAGRKLMVSVTRLMNRYSM